MDVATLIATSPTASLLDLWESANEMVARPDVLRGTRAYFSGLARDVLLELQKRAACGVS